MSRSCPAISAAVLTLLLAACGGGGGEEKATATPAAASPAPTETAAAGGAPECLKVEEPKPKPEGKLPKPKLVLDEDKTYVATVKTSCGDFEITLDPKRAPKTGGSFVSLARKNFYDDLIFHRVIPGFVIQGGDPQGSGLGGPGYTVVEKPPGNLTYDEGVVAMAKSGVDPPGASGSQFYVVVGPDGGQLPPEYALVGKVTKGLEVAQAIAAQPVGAEDRPVGAVVIESIDVKES